MDLILQVIPNFLIKLLNETEEWKYWDWIFAVITLLAGIEFIRKLFQFIFKWVDDSIWQPLARALVFINLKSIRTHIKNTLFDIKVALEFIHYPHRMLASGIRSISIGILGIGIGLYLTFVMPPIFSEIIGFFVIGWGCLILFANYYFFGAIRDLPRHVTKKRDHIYNLLKIVENSFVAGPPTELSKWIQMSKTTADQLLEFAEKIDGQNHITRQDKPPGNDKAPSLKT